MGSWMEVGCAGCGPVEVTTCAVEVHANRREDFAIFAVACPRCGELIVGGCPETIGRLVRSGARQLELRSTSAPPLTSDDLLDLHEWLATDPVWTVDDPR